jgi:hypothetical protein
MPTASPASTVLKELRLPALYHVQSAFTAPPLPQDLYLALQGLINLVPNKMMLQIVLIVLSLTTVPKLL